MIAFLWLISDKLSPPDPDRAKSDYQDENCTLSNSFQIHAVMSFQYY